MPVIISKNSIEAKIKNEQEMRWSIRHEEDVHKGLSRAKGAQRGDFGICKKFDGILKDYKSFKNPKDREKIKNDYYQAQREARHA